MPTNPNSQLLSSSIKELSFTDHFKDVADKLHFNTIGEILEGKVADLIKLPGFTYHFLQELVQFLEENELADLLKEG